MATNFPTSIDSFTNPSSGDTLNLPSHSAQHANINDAMVAVQTKLGTGSGTIGTWQTWTPTLANCTTTSIDAVYSKINKVVHVNCRLNIASVTGIVLITLPTTPSKIVIGLAEMSDASLNESYAGVVLQWSATQVFLRPWQTGATYATLNANQTATVPFTWASGDVMRLVLTYVEA